MNTKHIARLLAVAAVLPALAACSLTVPLHGQTEAGDETFTGSATGYLDHSGTLTVQSYVTGRQGRGTFKCSDGRSGPFEFVSTGTHGTGTGRIGNRRFTFTFG